MDEPGALIERIAGDEHITTDESERDGQYVSGAPASTSGYSRPSSITPNHRKNVTKMAPAGCRCVITNRQSNLECAHILRRATKLDDLKTLAFCWGIKLTDLDLDATDNMMWLTPDMHTSFDKSQWALVPPLEVLSDVLINLVRHERKAFTKLYPPKRDWEYTFAQLVPCPDTIVREDHHPPTIHYSPYTTLPIVTSHIHPYYVICNVAKKDAKYHEISHKAISGHYETLSNQRDLAQRIRTCRAIYDAWMREKPNATAHLAPPSRSSRSASSARSDRSTERSDARLERRTKRTQTFDFNSFSTPHEGDESGQHREALESGVTGSTSTPEGPRTVADDVHVYDTYSRLAVIPFESKVGQWLVEQGDLIDHGESSLVEESVESS